MRWGLDLTGASNWKIDAADLSKDLAYRTSPGTGGKLENGSSISPSADFFMEGSSNLRLGAAVGYGVTQHNLIYDTWSPSYVNFMDQGMLENKTSYGLLDIYLKYVPGGGKVGLFAGAGADYMMARTSISDNIDGSGHPQASNHKGTFSQNKVVPHLQAGAEFFLFKWLSLNIGAKYIFSAVLDDLTGNLTGPGVSPGKQLLIMTQTGSGEKIGYSPASAALPSGSRPFKYDLSGLRINAALRVYFH